MGARSFNPDLGENEPVRVTFWENVEIGYEHTIDEAAGEIVYTLDATGQRIPRTYRVHTHPTPRAVLVKLSVLKEEKIMALAEAFRARDGNASVTAMADILAAVAGPFVRKVYDDPTVNPAEGSEFIGWLVDVYGLGDVMMLASFAASLDETPDPADDEEEGADDAPFELAGLPPTPSPEH